MFEKIKAYIIHVLGGKTIQECEKEKGELYITGGYIATLAMKVLVEYLHNDVKWYDKAYSRICSDLDSYEDKLGLKNEFHRKYKPK